MQIKRLIRFHEKAERHVKEYLRFSADPSTQSKALSHLQKAARLHSNIAGLIRDLASVTTCTGREKLHRRDAPAPLN
jgi:DNA-binding SARP family transcriptional activator